MRIVRMSSRISSAVERKIGDRAVPSELPIFINTTEPPMSLNLLGMPESSHSRLVGVS
jgi:hypothetical protein